MARKRYHVSGTITYSFVGHVDLDAAEGTFEDARTSARDYLHDGCFNGSYQIDDDDIDVDPNAEEIG